MTSDNDYCAALVRERDRETYLAALFAPAERRGELFALYAFSLELDRIPNAVSEPLAGEIRLQWWRDALTGIRAEEARAHPVAAAVLALIEKRNVPVDLLVQMIDAREFDLQSEPMQSVHQLFEYLDQTTGGLIRVALKIGGEQDDSEAAVHAARAIGLTRRLQSFPHDVARGRLFVPLDLLASNGAHTSEVMTGKHSLGLSAALAELRMIARAELQTARSYAGKHGISAAYLPLAFTPLYLAQMEKAGYDPFHTDVRVSALRAQFELWRVSRTGKF